MSQKSGVKLFSFFKRAYLLKVIYTSGKKAKSILRKYMDFKEHPTLPNRFKLPKPSIFKLLFINVNFVYIYKCDEQSL